MGRQGGQSHTCLLYTSGIQDSLARAAAHRPRVDAIGGSSAGVIINSEVRTSSLFRGVSQEDIETVSYTHLDVYKRQALR